MAGNKSHFVVGRAYYYGAHLPKYQRNTKQYICTSIVRGIVNFRRCNDKVNFKHGVESKTAARWYPVLVRKVAHWK